ncbi:T9SS type A sorting domain-containing protein [Pontibacter akesuensis]|uniref:Por secretion system C-terminal sorting domain-containing protein n=1 Tax=Pontibacter akesuensis TaxID=388950 RepID=A0A1I7I594_9BACT|nr:T9SS type A sorting domain-containing protein [Pontibacter akesuensis]GHA65279.1 hypothetical protein GCM10007389_17610 [Pontibacter akesuensis]SFU68082.1 Por secretion system C-terminal sorting domain-containing protein [Pontibacter akesuensis]
MKYLYLLTTLVLLAYTTQAQITIYHEDFSTTVEGITAAPAGSWAAYTDGVTTNSDPLASRGVYYSTTQTVNGTQAFVVRNKVSTLGFSSATITWSEYRTSGKDGNSSPVNLYYSVDGITYTKITGFTQKNTTYNTWTKINDGVAFLLPAAALGQSNLHLKWEVSVPLSNGSNKQSAFYGIDDISISGMPEEGVSVLNWADIALNEDPFAAGKSYAVHENSVTFSRASAAGVTVSKALVTNADFQNPIKSLTLIQTGATATRGTTLKMNFTEPVSDLTFTLFDVDQVTGQFQDQLVIKGKGFWGQEIILKKTKVKTTFNNSFSPTASSATGVSGADVAAAANGGNVTFTFSEPVGEVTIEYYNNDAAKGNQGIGIHNLNWRRAHAISALPVELIFFKGAVQNSSAKLSWATAQEQENEKFEVERSLDGKTFLKVGEVQGKGNSSIRTAYSYTDTTPGAGTTYYRLRQIDYDGTVSFSNVIALNVQGQSLQGANLANIYPTLASSEVNISLAVDQATVRVLDVNGRAVGQYTLKTSSMVLPVENLQPGVYFVVITDGTRQQTQRIVKR